MISHLKQYIIDRMTCSYKFGCIFLLCMVRYIFFYVNVISTLSGITYKNIEKMANKIFDVPNHLMLNVMQSAPDKYIIPFFA